MKKFSTISEAITVIQQLCDYWSDVLTITNIKAEKGMNEYGYFVDMTANSVSFTFLEALKKATNDFNPIVFPLDNECIQIGVYIIINGSDE